MWGIIKCTNICIMRVQKERKARKGQKIFKEIMGESFLNFRKIFTLHI